MEFTFGREPSLANTIIERVGEKKEAWMVFDMDETLARWKKLKEGDVFSLRPTVIPFLQKILDAEVNIHFAIYSNTHAKERAETIASTIGVAFEGDENFHLSFIFYNHFKGNPTEAGLRRLNVNTNASRIGNAKRAVYDINKTVESIKYGYAETGVPLAEEDIRTHLFFFDDLIYPSIKNVIGQNYIQMRPFLGEEGPISGNRGTKKRNREEVLSASKKSKARKTRQRKNRRAL
jgi:hypothetical protein